jgi:Protein of unknown function (DUF2934)
MFMRHKESMAPKANGGFGPIMADEPNHSHEQQIAEAAYFIAESRGFSGDHALDDWLQAEAEIKIKGEHPKRAPHPISF